MFLVFVVRNKGKDNMANKSQEEHSHFTYVKWTEFFKPPEQPSQKAQKKPHVPTTGRGPNSRTIDALNDLRRIRSDAIKNGFPIPKREIAMEVAGGVSSNTWKKQDPELWKYWYEKQYKMKIINYRQKP
jgi:hypothetical protein